MKNILVVIIIITVNNNNKHLMAFEHSLKIACKDIWQSSVYSNVRLSNTCIMSNSIREYERGRDLCDIKYGNEDEKKIGLKELMHKIIQICFCYGLKEVFKMNIFASLFQYYIYHVLLIDAIFMKNFFHISYSILMSANFYLTKILYPPNHQNLFIPRLSPD